MSFLNEALFAKPGISALDANSKDAYRSVFILHMVLSGQYMLNANDPVQTVQTTQIRNLV